MHILLVEDDPALADSTARALRSQGWVVDVTARGEPVPLSVRQDPYDLVILDIGLPGIDGFETLRRVRAQGSATPVLMLTARDAVEDRVRGLDAGADDYLVKPFDLDELLARVRALLRRAAGRADPVLAHGRLRLDPARRQAWCDEAPLALSAREFALLHALLERPGAVLSRGQLEERLYGWNDRLGSNAVEVHVHHLRRKLGDSAIRTVRGVGYAIGE